MQNIKIIFLAFAILLGLGANCQQPDGAYTPFHAGGNLFKNTSGDLAGRTLLVILDDSLSDYGKTLKKSFSQYWKVTPVKFIKSSEVNGYIENDQYAIFTFYIDDCILGNSGGQYFVPQPNGGVSSQSSVGLVVFKEMDIIAPDSVPPYINYTQKQVDKIGVKALDQYYFEFKLCGKFADPKKGHTLENLECCEYQRIIITTSPAMALKHYQAFVTPFVLPLVTRFQRDVKNEIDSKNDEVNQETVPAPVMSNGKEHNIKFTVQSFNGGMKAINGKKIYVDTAIGSQNFIKIYSHLLNTDPSNFIPVTRSEIEKLYITADTNALEIDYCVSGGDNPLIGMIAVYSCKGDKLAQFKIPFEFYKRESDYK